MARSFPDAATSAVQMIYTLILLVSIPTMLICGVLTSVMSKKRICILGMSILLVGGLMPLAFSSRMWMLYFSSAVIGAGIGLINVISSALISDHFDGLEKGRIMGYQSAAVSAGAALCTKASGAIGASYGWGASYAVFLIVIPMLILFAILMPEDRRQPAEARRGKTDVRRVVWWSVLSLLFCLFMVAYQTNISMFLEEAALGSTALAGTISSLLMLIGIPAGLAVGCIMKRLGRHATGLSSLMVALGVLCTAAAQSVVMVCVGAFLFGLGFAVRAPASVTGAAYLAAPGAVTASIALVNGLGSLGSFLSPSIINSIAAPFGGSFRSAMWICGVCLLAVSALYLLANPLRSEDMLTAQEKGDA